MNLRALMSGLAFWKPKSERIAAKRPSVPDAKPSIDVSGGMRLLTRVRNTLWGRVGNQAKQDEDAYYGGTCHSRRRRPGTRPAIRPSDRVKELRVSRRPAKPFPRPPEKQRCFVLDPVTRAIIGEKWLRPAEQTEFTIRAGRGVSLVA